jgi:spore coat polysaccharide biosynthesis protein SpsF
MNQSAPKSVAIIQARMGSTRLPGKTLMMLGDETVLGRVVRRLSRATRITQIVVATTICHADEAIVSECRRLGVASFLGPENDVLERYSLAANAFSAEVIIRITADCPLIDPGVVDEVVRQLIDQGADFASNVVPRTYPRGLDIEAFTKAALARTVDLAKQPFHREHVTPVFYEHRDQFRFAAVTSPQDWSQHRWTLDTREDLQLIRAIYEKFDNRDDFTWREAVDLVERSPELASVNAHIQQKELQSITGFLAL